MSVSKEAAPVAYNTVDGDVLKIDPENLKRFLMSEKGMLPAYPATRAILDRKKPLLKQWVDALVTRYRAVLVDSAAEGLTLLTRRAREASFQFEASGTELMSDSEFWSLVQKLGWGTRTTDSKMLSKAIMARYTPEQCNGIRQAFSKFKSALNKKTQQWEQANEVNIAVSEDSFDDLLSHIVGLGHQVYEASFNNPKLVDQRASARKYTESFAYALPTADDFDNFDVKRYQDWAKRQIESYLKEIRKPDLRPLLPLVKRVTDLLKVMVRGDYRAFLMSETEGRKLAEDIEKAYVRFCHANGGSNYSVESTALSNKWGVWNLYTDVENYLMPDPGVMKLSFSSAARKDAVKAASVKLANGLTFSTKQFMYAKGVFSGEASELGFEPGQWPHEITLVSAVTGNKAVFKRVLLNPSLAEYHSNDPLVNAKVLIFNT